MIVQNLICITRLLLAAYSNTNFMRYFGLYLIAAGSTGCVPVVLAYVWVILHLSNLQWPLMPSYNRVQIT